jgi:hypothetical protein
LVLAAELVVGSGVLPQAVEVRPLEWVEEPDGRTTPV